MKAQGHIDRFFRCRAMAAWVLAALGVWPSAAQAQYTGSYQTITIDGVASNWTDYGGVYMIGGQSGASNFASDVLIIQNGGTLTNASTAYIGYNGNNNKVIVDGNGSAWNIGGQLHFGKVANAWGEVLIITNGGTVKNTGASYIGWDGAGTTPASAHRLTVTGSNSTWTSLGGLSVGNGGGPYNRIDVLNGGSAWINGPVNLGNFSQCPSNTINVSGTGSLLQVSGSLTMSQGATVGQRFFISTGGVARIVGNLAVGLAQGGRGHFVQIDNGTLYVTSSVSSTPAILSAGSNSMVVLNSGSITVDRLTVANGTGAVMQFNGGSLTTSGATVSNGTAFTVGDGARAATLNLDGSTNTFADGLILNTNATLMVSGTNNAISTTRIAGNLELRQNSLLQWDCNATTQDWAVVTGIATLAPSVTVKLTSLDGSTPAVIPLLSAAGGFSGDPSGWPRSSAAGRAYRAAINGTTLQLVGLPSGAVICVR